MKLKNLSLVLAGVVALSTSAGCMTKQPPKYDESKTTVVKVLAYDAGYGRDFIQKPADKFMEITKDIPYEENKSGVYVDIDYNPSAYGDAVAMKFGDPDYDIFMTQGLTLKQLDNSKSMLMNLNDLLNATTSNNQFASDYVEEESILERMDEDHKDYFYNQTATYSVPLFVGSYLMTYDEELMKDKALFIGDNSTDSYIEWVDEYGVKNPGPDGVYNTYDDGLPQTYAQMATWFTQMNSVYSITPLHYSGKQAVHMTFLMNGFWSNAEGKEGVEMSFDPDGKTVPAGKLITGFGENDTPIYNTEPVSITYENANMLLKQKSIYQAVELAKQFSQHPGTWISGSAFAGQESHTDAQSTYLNSKFTSEPMLLFTDGSFWETEAAGVFEEGEEYGAGRMDRQLKILPFPHPDRSVYGADGKTSTTAVRQTIVVDSELQMIVRKDIDPAKLKAVQDFFLYFNSQEGMAITTAYSAVPRPYRYEVPAEIAALASTYAKSVKNYLHNENTDMVLRAANNPLFNAKGGGTDYYSHYSYPFNSEYATGWSDYTIVNKFYEQQNALQPNNITPRRWFEGIYNFTTKKISATETRWHSYLRDAGLV